MPVVLLAHGSRHRHGVTSIETVGAAVAARSGLDVRTAYLDLNQPDLAAAAQHVRADGHRAAIIVPLLFTPAFHARTDAPATIATASAASGVELLTADIIGTPDELLEPLLAAGASAGIPEAGPVLLTSVGSSRPEANAAVVELADRLAAARGDAVTAAFATCAPRAVELLRTRPDIVGVLALFVGHGLLLDRISAAATACAVPIAAPLEEALSSLVIARYDAARSSLR